MHVLKPILMDYTDKLPFSGRQKVHRTTYYLRKESHFCYFMLSLDLPKAAYIYVVPIYDYINLLF